MNLQSSFSSVSAHSMMVGEEGGLWVWGINDRGSLGLGDYFHRNHPAQLKIGDSEVTSISLGFKFTLALTKDGNLYTWGRNNFGQLGLGDLVDKTTPQLLVVSEGLLRVSSISAGDSFSVVTLEDGSMYSWGLNTSGQLGLGDTQNRLTPTLIPFPEPVEFTKIACGGHHVLAITKEGHLWVWGRSVSGQLGLGDRVDRPVPTRHPISVGLVDIAVGGFHSVALTREGEMFTWGTNKHGQLGLGDLNGRKEPCKVPLDDVVAVSTGWSHAMALTREGSLYIWGENADGELGLGDTEDKPNPEELLIPADFPIVFIAASSYHSMVLTKDGSLWVWGRNTDGRLGLSEKMNRKKPVLFPHMKFKLPPSALKKMVFPLPCSENFPDSQVVSVDGAEMEFHKMVIDVRCPALLPFLVASPTGKFDTENQNSGISKIFPASKKILLQFRSFIYTNFANFDEFSASELLELIEISKSLEFPELTYICHKKFLDILNSGNSFSALLACIESTNLGVEKNWIVGYLRKHKILLKRTELRMVPPEIAKFLPKGESVVNPEEDQEESAIGDEGKEETKEDGAKEEEETKEEGENTAIKGEEGAGEQKAKEGLEEGREEGREVGREEGKEEGREDVREDGKEEEQEDEKRSFPEEDTENLKHFAFPPILEVIPPKPIEPILNEMFASGIHSDFEILAIRGEQSKLFKVHKAILSKWIFFSKILAKQESPTSHVTEMPLETFQKMIGYFYSGSAKNLRFVDCGWILSLAGYYAIEEEKDLVQVCKNKINSEITGANWREVFDASAELGNSELRERALEAIPKFELAGMFYGMREEKKELKERLTRVEGEAKAQVEGLRREVEELRGAKEEAERGMHEMQERMASLEASVRTLLEKSGI